MVYELLDKGIVLLCCILLSGVVGLDARFVSAAHLAVIISLTIYINRFPKYTSEILIILYALSIILMPVNIVFVPLIIYDVAGKHMRIAAISIIVIYICIVYCSAKGVWLVDKDSSSGILIASVCAAVISMVSILLGFRTGKLLEAEENMRKLRDDSIENSLLLDLRNKELIERQNYEINVATLKERNRIAREIHDNVGHMLTRAILQTGALGVIVKDENIKAQIEDINNTLNTAMDNVRTSVHDLHDESIDMRKAVEEIVAGFPSLDIVLDYDVRCNVGNDIKYSFIAIIKEALNNTARHSNGTRVRINVTEHPGFYQLIISDNGTNISDNYIGGMGLSGIAERVKQLHGNLNINTDKGFRISISVMK